MAQQQTVAYYTIGEAARALGMSVESVRIRLNDGRLEAAVTTGGSRRLVSAASLEREIARRKGGAAHE